MKFSLHPSCQLVPNIQVTLLRLKNDGKVCAQSTESTNDEATFSEESVASTSSGWFFILMIFKYGLGFFFKICT